MVVISWSWITSLYNNNKESSVLHPRQLSTPHKTNVVQVHSSNLSRSFCSVINITSSQEFSFFRQAKVKLAQNARQARWEHPSRVSRAPRPLRAKRTRNACCTFKNIELRVLQTKLKAQTRPSPGLDQKGSFSAITYAIKVCSLPSLVASSC